MIVLGSFSISLAQEADWKTKNFDEWTSADVEAILEKSAWVEKQEVRLQNEGRANAVAGSVVSNVSLPATVNNTVITGGVSPAIDFTFKLRLRSSMAIRLALVRKMQIETDTEKLSDEEFKEFNKKLNGTYQCPACADNYVLSLSSSSVESKGADPVYQTFGNARLEDLKRYITLKNEKGEKRELVFFTPPKAPGGEAVFFFRRFDEKGSPLFTKESKKIIFNTTDNNVNTATNFKIDIAPIVVGEKVDF